MGPSLQHLEFPEGFAKCASTAARGGKPSEQSSALASAPRDRGAAPCRAGRSKAARPSSRLAADCALLLSRAWWEGRLRLRLAADFSMYLSWLGDWPQPLILSTCWLADLPCPLAPPLAAPGAGQSPVAPHDPACGCSPQLGRGNKSCRVMGLKEKHQYLL